jgi:hypothetical protein
MRLVGSSLFAVLLCARGVSDGSEITPADSTKPLFRLFAPVPTSTSDSLARESVTFDDKRPLMTVRSVSDLLLAPDQKGVRITLTPSDTKKFAVLTRKYNQQLLLFEADGEVLAALRITAPIVDGIIGFKHPEEALLQSICAADFASGSSNEV